MIYTMLLGRLGNHLFIYAYARALQLKHGHRNILIDVSSVRHNSLAAYALPEEVSFTAERRVEQQLNFLQRTALSYHAKKTAGMNQNQRFCFEKKQARLFNLLGLMICANGYLPLKGRRKDMLLYGYFQSEKFFGEIRQTLLEDLVPIDPPPPKNEPLLQKIDQTQSVCVSIRRGDFLGNPWHEVCTMDYFAKAMDVMAQKVQNPVFFIFSDDVDWLKTNAQFKYPVFFEDGTDPDYEKLRMMSRCKHFVLSNSSFSWWAQYLSTHPGKVVAAPDRWYATPVPCDVYHPDWILIKP